MQKITQLNPDPAISQSVMKAMMHMKKIDIEGLKRHAGENP